MREIVVLGNRVENSVIETTSIFERVNGELVCKASELPSAHKFAQRGYSHESVLPTYEAGGHV